MAGSLGRSSIGGAGSFGEPSTGGTSDSGGLPVTGPFGSGLPGGAIDGVPGSDGRSGPDAGAVGKLLGGDDGIIGSDAELGGVERPVVGPTRGQHRRHE